MENYISDDAIKASTLKMVKHYDKVMGGWNITEHDFSLKSTKRMRNILRRAFSFSGQIKFTFLYRKTIAVIACICVLIATPMSIEAVRTAIFEFIAEVYETYTHYFFATNDTTQHSDEVFVEHVPTYVPEGFELIDEDHDETVYLAYENGTDSITYYQQRLIDFSMNLNTEGIEVEEFVYRGCQAQYFSNAGHNYLLWYDDEYCYLVISTLDRETVFQIADSIK